MISMKLLAVTSISSFLNLFSRLISNLSFMPLSFYVLILKGFGLFMVFILNVILTDLWSLPMSAFVITSQYATLPLWLHKAKIYIWGRYHGGRRPSSDDSFHSPTIIPPSALHKPSVKKRYHRRRTTRWGVTACSPTMVTLHDTRFIEHRWWNDGWTLKTVITWRLSASMIPAPGFLFLYLVTPKSSIWFLASEKVYLL